MQLFINEYKILCGCTNLQYLSKSQLNNNRTVKNRIRIHISIIEIIFKFILLTQLKLEFKYFYVW